MRKDSSSAITKYPIDKLAPGQPDMLGNVSQD